MKTQDLLILAALGVGLYLLARERGGSAGAGAGAYAGGGAPPIEVDPWAQRIDASVGALDTLWDIGSSLFGGSSSGGNDVHVA